MSKIIFSFVALLMIASCAPEPGSQAWCEAMDEKPAGEWTANEATEYAGSCIFSSGDEEE